MLTKLRHNPESKPDAYFTAKFKKWLDLREIECILHSDSQLVITLDPSLGACSL